MPPVLAAVAAAGFAAAAGTTVFGLSLLASAAVIGAATLALSYASAAIADKPRAQAFEPLAFASGERTQNVRQPITNWRIVYGQVRIGGPVTFASSTNSNANLNWLLTLACHECAELGTIYIDDDAVTLDGSGNVTDGRVSGQARIYTSTGSAASDTALLAALSANTAGTWATTHRQDGHAKLYVYFTYAASAFPGGLPVVSCIVKGRAVYDPRSRATAWSANPALCILDYLMDETLGLGASSDEIDNDSFIGAANICDEAIPLAAGGTEARYTLNGTIDTGAEPAKNIESMLTACAGTLVYTGGKWRLVVASWRAPTLELDEDDLDGAIRVKTNQSRRDLWNGVKGVFVDPNSHWQPTDFPAVQVAAYVTLDASEEIWRDVDYPFTTSATTAQRLAKFELERCRRQIEVVAPFKLSAWRVQPGDTIALTKSSYGWTAKEFAVVSQTFSIRTDRDGGPYLGIDMSLREIDSGVYVWTSLSEGTYLSSTATNLPNAFDVSNPGAPTVAESLYETRDGAGVKAKVGISWTASADAFLRGYIARFKLSSSSTWTYLAEQIAETREILDIAPGTYDFAVAAVNQLGVRSDFADAVRTGVVVVGLGAVPANISGFSVRAISGLAVASWTAATDLDVRIGGRVRVRHTDLTSGAAWSDGVDLPGPEIPGSSTTAIFELLAGTYMAKFVDSTGQESAAIVSVAISTAPDPFAFTVSATATEHSAFSGTKSNLVVASLNLKLDTSGGAVLAAGTYTFANAIDLATVMHSRLRSTLGAAVTNVTTLLDSRTALIDDWEDFDGTGGTAAQVDLYYRSTPDNPASSPTWSSWKRFVIADEYARAFQFKAEFTSTDTAYNILVDTLVVTAEII